MVSMLVSPSLLKLWLRVLFLWLFYYALHVGARNSFIERLGRGYEHHEVNLDQSKHDEEFFTFVTRPDLVAPRWNVEVYNESRVSPGYWFTSPYPEVQQTQQGDAWVAPHIYDSEGDLIWSGAATFGGYSTFDFRSVNILGKPMLSLINYHEGEVWILDDTYSVYRKIDIGDRSAKLVNMHEFTTVEHGTRALHMLRDDTFATTEDSKGIGFDGKCFVDFDGFRELDVETWEPTFSWSSAEHIGLNESYAHRHSVQQRCGDTSTPWEFLHLNSVDKFPDGDYLVSGRRTFAIYKVSHIDGSIVWRLGGTKSDFELDVKFSGQHSARVHKQNETHTIISFFDNSWYKDYIEPTHGNSRGVLLALRTDTMRTETLATFDHPEGKYTKSRGNMEILPNNHAWICWVHRAMHTEHAADGTLIMKARFRAELDSYRSFKIPWVGRPNSPPDVHAAALKDENQKIVTLVHVSWNGATEVARWILWHTDSEGRYLELVVETRRQGFETAMKTTSFAAYVIVEGLDEYGVSLGTSNVIQTLLSEDRLSPGLGAEDEWQENKASTLLQNPVVPFVCGIVLAIVGFALVCATRKLKWRSSATRKQEKKTYKPLLQDSLDDDLALRVLTRSTVDDS